ncbi:uncharacterized protein BO80DRAFT_262771 [Aspergillus ibericus CBS 121593]|uniref:Serine-threonine rich protein n=1 Tax=Aspergillus ibericus CBS 121593 TaxID=1448316 RepID=A0A395GJ12_9EURO|nr:serine-threonine rich protein [Aspergillus ibericus CBS 121593]RAK95465.1 serine-threonine rich protein [Aspergillus ibericus CBS 121593]
MIYPVAVSNVRAVRWSTTVTGGRPRAIQFASSRLLQSSLQRRQLWRCTDQRYNYDYLAKQMDKQRRLCMSKLRDVPARHPRKAHMYERHHLWRNRDCGSGYRKDNPSRFEKDREHKHDFWEAERARAKQRMEQMRSEIEKDPYAALFGRRLEPFRSFERLENTFTSLCRSLLGLDKPSNTINTTARPKTSAAASKDAPDVGKEAKSNISRGSQSSTGVSSGAGKSSYEFDPISGRMVPKPSAQTTPAGKGTRGNGHTASVDTPHSHFERTGYMSAINRSAEGPQSRKVSKSSQTESNLQRNVPVAPVADETIQAQELQDSRLSKRTQNRASWTLATPRGPPKDILEESGSPSGTIIAGPPKAQDKMGPNDAINGGGTTYEHLEMPLNNYLFRDQEGGERLTKSSAPKGILDSTQEQDRMRAEKEDDLDLLSASDIRSHYYMDNFEPHPDTKKQTRKSMDDKFDSFVDPAGDIDAQSVRSKFQAHGAVGAIDEATKPTKTDTRVQPDSQDVKPLGTSQAVIQNDEHQATQHSDHTTNTPQPLPDSSAIETYRVLAYDPSTLQVTEADTSSSFHTSNKPIHPTRVLSRLNAPAKFLPYFAKMHADGYEIVYGGGDLLVFRKTSGSLYKEDGLSPKTARKVEANLKSQGNEASRQSISPSKLPLAQGSASAEHSSSQAPQHQPVLPDDSASQGQSSSSKNASRLGQAVRRMFIGGVATAGTCYAIGVVVEYFRTGGQDGRGIDAFTAFESERRHGD